MDFSKPFAIVDLSSYVFYRYHAIQRWIKISGVEDFDQAKLVEKFQKTFLTNLQMIKKKLKLEWPNVIFAKDCPREQIWRLGLFQNYKKNRSVKNEGFDPIVFTHTYNVLMPKMLQDEKVSLYGCPTAEADDVIAVIHDEIRKKNANTPIYILTMDTDFLQLAHDNTRIISFQLKDLGVKFSKEELDKYLLWKIIKGDESDNIPPIEKKVGVITAWKLAFNEEMLNQKLLNAQTKQQFEINKQLIDFKAIPQSIRNQLKSVFHK